MEVLKTQQTGGLKRTFTTIVNGTSGVSNAASKSANGTQEKAGDSASDLAGLEMNGHVEEQKAPNLASAIHLTPDWDIGYNKLVFADEGVLFEDAQIQVGLRSEYRGHIGVLKLYFTNKATFAIGSFTTTLDNKSNPDLKIDTRELPEPSIGPDSQTQQTIFCTAQAPFSESPTIRISFLAGALQAYTLRLPVLPHKYMDPSELSPEDFFKRWRQIGAGPMEAQSTFGLVAKGRSMSDEFTRRVISQLKWRILEGVDPNPKNFVGCAVFQVEKGKTGCLLRLEPNTEQKVCLSETPLTSYVLTACRCTV